MATRSTFGYIRKLPSGKFQASYTAKDGVRHNAPFTFLTRTDANGWLSKEHAKLLSGSWISPKALEAKSALPTNFGEYALRHIKLQTNSRGETLRESTKALYRRLLNTNLKPFISFNIEDITGSMVSEWWVEQIADGKKTQPSKAYKLINAVMRRAASDKLITTNPCMVKGANTAVTGKTVPTPTPDEVTLIAANINPRYKQLVILAAYGGLRFGEITELRRKDLHLVDREGKRAYNIEVKRAVTLVKGEKGAAKHVIDRPKSHAGIRTVQILSALTPMLDDLLNEISQPAETLLFPAAKGSQISRTKEKHLRHDVFMNSWRPALKRAGLEDKKYAPPWTASFCRYLLAPPGRQHRGTQGMAGRLVDLGRNALCPRYRPNG